MSYLMVIAWLSCVVKVEQAKILEVKEYLKKYGYFNMATSRQAVMDSAVVMRRALSSYQETAGVPVTGVADAATLAAMKRSRCGLPDLEPTRNKRYTLASKWRRRSLTYAISNETHATKSDEISDIIDRSFQRWSNVSGIRLKKSNNTKTADIVLYFLKGSHKTNRTNHVDSRLSFDGPGGVLAHASFPTVGEIHFDDAEKWIFQDRKENSSGFHLEWAAMHEIGHALGLRHSKRVRNIMNPHYIDTEVKLGEDDIEGIQKLYGKVGSMPTTEQYRDEKTTAPSQPSPSCPTLQKIDAVLTLGKITYFFYGDKVWIIKKNYTDREEVYGVPIGSVFDGIEGPITAAMAASRSKVLFFQDKLYWRWDGHQKTAERGFPRAVAGLGYINSNVRAAFTWSTNRKSYVFGGGIYWRYSRNRVEAGYPRATTTWKGIPNVFDGITSFGTSGQTYIFKDKYYLTYNDTSYSIIPGRKPIRSKWVLCKPFDNEVESLSNLKVATNSDTCPRLSLILMLWTVIIRLKGFS